MNAAEVIAKILVVDDHEQNRDLVVATLEPEGYHIIQAANGDEALLAFERAPPDCVLLDVRMPGLDGFTVCQRMRASPGGQDVPIIFLTALRDVDTFDRAQVVGADDFLTKPVRPTELLLRIQGVLRLRRMSTELREHYELIRRQRDDLMRLQLQKEMLMSFVIHDLKNPVAAMDLMAQVLMRDRALPASARETAQQIRGSARHLMRLIHNLLDLSKSEEGKLVPKLAPVDLQALVNGVCATFEAHALAVRATLEGHVQVSSVVADQDLMERVLENLTENALRHSSAGGKVQISTELRGDKVEIHVADQGPGIPVEMREKIFDRFVQIENSSTSTTRSGRGLGLTFCKLAVEAHGGRIWIEDGNPGTVVCITVPHVASS